MHLTRAFQPSDVRHGAHADPFGLVKQLYDKLMTNGTQKA